FRRDAVYRGKRRTAESSRRRPLRYGCCSGACGARHARGRRASSAFTKKVGPRRAQVKRKFRSGMSRHSFFPWRAGKVVLGFRVAMNQIVCIAYVPDTETKIRIAAGGVSIDEADVKWIVSPYDEYALEGALKTKEAKGGTVTALTFGPVRADTGLRECLARGADDAVRIASEGL